MNEKEKKAIEYIKELDITRIFYDNPPSDNHVSMGGAIEILLNLIENQEAEIEENHKQENGKLRERVKELEEKLEKINKQLDLDYVDNNYIPVSLVKEKIEEYKKKSEEYEENKKDDFMGFWQMEFLKACHKLQAYEELLEKRK